MAPTTSTESRTVSGYFKELGIRPAKNSDRFWRRIGGQFGVDTQRHLESIIRARTDNDGRGDIYSAKNQNLALSVEFSRWSADLYRRYLEWFVTYIPRSPRAILDVGCDNGVVTCFYALRYPKATVVGMDIDASGIRCARELAKAIGVSNATFIESDIANAGQHFGEGYFDVVTSLCSFNEIIGIPHFPPHWRRDDIEFDLGPVEPALLGVQSVMDKEGILVSADRFFGVLIDGLVWWATKLGTIGLNVDWGASDWLNFHEVGDRRYLPLIVAGGAIPTGSIVEGAVSLYMKGSHALSSSEEGILYELEAELCFDSLCDKQLVEGFEADRADGSGRMRVEVWQHSSGVVVYMYSNAGLRKILCYDVSMLKQAVKGMRKLRHSREFVGSTSESYTHPRI
jgi:SAM-dependent methyltransferase